MAIRRVHFYLGPDGETAFSVGEVAWSTEGAVNAISAQEQVLGISFEETVAGSELEWHDAPHRQYVITLSGQLEFEMRSGAKVTLGAGDVLLAEDVTGGGHRWRLIDDEPWRRVYVTLA
jgi:quercetin dioxygenase-like cupin family protein